MTIINSIRACLLVLSAALAVTLSNTAMAGFSVSGTQLIDANGNAFVMRGINHPHTWYTSETASFGDIAATGANTVRVVLSNGGQWTRNSGSDVANVISLCKENKLICVLEVHDSTGYPESSGAVPLEESAAYWTSPDILQVIQGEEDYIIINIANEPFGNSGVNSDTYVNGTIEAIQSLRLAGLTHTLMVDAANWGQDWQFFMRDNAPQIFAADSQSNTIFSVHMYEVFSSASNQESYIQAFQSHGLPLIIGEFGASHGGQDIDIDSLLDLAQQHGIGYIGWSWSGNGDCCLALDLVSNFDSSDLTPWGQRLINGSNGITETSLIATIFDSSGGNPPTNDEMCTWSDGSIWPICKVDIGDWGYEAGQSCISRSICPNAGSIGTGNRKIDRFLKQQDREWRRFLKRQKGEYRRFKKRQNRKLNRVLDKL
ncbi:cellulase family glycosylhydrolase [Arenicella sp. 4NH20-0111]|uniref:cellulase family glycosylhydrolase n=1 Tax=Arenicella sp. 4NH20-0111 TaxID=3127648 RepID=UPI0031024757